MYASSQRKNTLENNSDDNNDDDKIKTAPIWSQNSINKPHTQYIYIPSGYLT
jgi:hypothetical protein